MISYKIASERNVWSAHWVVEKVVAGDITVVAKKEEHATAIIRACEPLRDGQLP